MQSWRTLHTAADENTALAAARKAWLAEHKPQHRGMASAARMEGDDDEMTPGELSDWSGVDKLVASCSPQLRGRIFPAF